MVALLDRGVGEPDDDDLGVAGAGDVGLDLDAERADSVQGAGEELGEGHGGEEGARR